MKASLRTKTIASYLVAMAVLFASAKAEAAPGTCFKALTDPHKRIAEDFMDLVGDEKPIAAKGVLNFLSVNDASEVNIDFYYLKFSAPKTGTLASWFKELRLHFKKYAEGEKRQFGFDAYGSEPDKIDDLLFEANAKLWKQDIPLGALMSFDLGSLWPSTFYKGGYGYGFAHADGDLQVTCATKTDFVFTTLNSERGGKHPVSGRRGFGIQDNGNGTWMFYSKAVDAVTQSAKNAGARILRYDVLCLGHDFWRQFYGEMKKELLSKGLRVEEYYDGNHGPVPYPFKYGEQPGTRECPSPKTAASQKAVPAGGG